MIKKNVLFILRFCVLPLMICFFEITGTEKITGFGVTKNETIYLGHSSGLNYAKVDVIDGGEIIDVLRFPFTRGYEFTMDEKETFFVTANGHLYVLNLRGEILQTKEQITELDRKQHWMIYNNRYRQERNQAIYQLRYQLGYYFVERTAEAETVIIYKMPMKEYLQNIIYAVLWGEFAVNIVWGGLLYSRKHPRDSNVKWWK